MPMCSIKQCGARKSKNRPNLTLHSVPKNEVLRRKWLNAIGLENINPRHKELYICSLHFEESHFNRTLDVVRLRENAVPTLFNMPSTSKHMIYTQKENLDPSPKMPPISKPVLVLCGTGNVPEEQDTAMSHQENKLTPAHEMLPTSKNVPVLCETGNIQGKMEPKKYSFPAYDMPSSSAAGQDSIFQEEEVLLKEQPAREILIPAAGQPSSSSAASQVSILVSQQFNKFQKLEKICQEQKKKIKRLQEKVRRQGKKIGNLEDILKDLKQKLIINNEQSILLEECGGSQDFFKATDCKI
ncbi:uncharacterized protein LOC133525226 [Cydia pomonella]|uniref:uncharacterized protein LOC133525226 n=1 Tax=Cydia pomonella TaxID=82600 RepID=UPI002ADDF6D4|nr:uncharacterized protein LOC133525226 [Cydia pomonella]